MKRILQISDSSVGLSMMGALVPISLTEHQTKYNDTNVNWPKDTDKELLLDSNIGGHAIICKGLKATFWHIYILNTESDTCTLT